MHPRALNRLNEHGEIEYYFIAGWRFFRLATYSDHGVVKVCCGKAGKRKCMYFDVGSKSYTGQYGGEDHWFSPEENDFLDEMDLDSEAPWNGL